MTMILQLLLVAVAAGLGVHAAVYVPAYKYFVQQVQEAAKTLQRNVLSMEGNIPLLNDSRRHYAEIVHVINGLGLADSGCVRLPYYEEYQKLLNVFAPEALNNPANVVTEVADLIDEVQHNTAQLKDLIAACVHENESICNQLVTDTINENKHQYGYQSDLLIAAARVAFDLNGKNEKFEEVSKNLKAHQYVCTSPRELESIVHGLGVLHMVLNRRHPPVPLC